MNKFLTRVFALQRTLSVVIIAVMLKAVFMIENTQTLHSDRVKAEMDRAAAALRQEGFVSGILAADSAGQALAKARDLQEAAGAGSGEGFSQTLFVCACGSLLRGLLQEGAYAIGYAHADNAGERFSGAPYIVQEPDLVDADSYVKMYQRAAGLPWTILETERCLVREFTTEDLDGIYALYDEQACRFLEPPSADRGREREILGAYIERIYGLYGFGHWAVFSREEPGVLLGRIGYSAITAGQEQEAKALGIPVPDADFGFLVGAKWRGQGIAGEVCRALLQYGISELGFTRIRADARNDNTASIRLLTELGFVAAGPCAPEKEKEGAQKTVFLFEHFEEV